MEINLPRRNFLKILAVATSGLVGCSGKRLPTNVLSIEDISEELVCSNEEEIDSAARIGILGNFYWGIPMNNETRKLNNGEPSYALIPEEKSKISIKRVGKKGGKVIISAPKGDLYFPYNYSYDVKSEERKLNADFSETKPARIITNFRMNKIKKPSPNNGKISLEKASIEDFPFADETLKVLGKERYLVFRADDYNEFNNPNILPIYFVKLPFDVEYNRTESDRRIRVFGETYLFKKGQRMNEYLRDRGFINPLKETTKKRTQNQSGSTDTQTQ